MGAYQSKLTPEEVEELQASTHFSTREVESLYRRFKKLDRKRGGSITRDDFHLIPELSMNPLCDRIIALFDPLQSDAVTFDVFCHTVQLFSPHAVLKERVRAVFALYDIDGDGRLTAVDLLAILRLLVGDNIDEATLQAIVRQTLEECGQTGPEAALTLDDFDRILGPDIADLTIPVHTPEF